jgi:DNA polymerase-3 subunit epsilon
MITHITGSTREMVANAPRIEEVVPALLEFLDGAVIVAHNASFDVGFLNYELQRLKGRRLGEGAIDTLPLARLLAPGLPNYRLRTVADALEAPVTACHRALADAQACGHVFVTLVGRLQERGITRLGEARAFLSPNTRSAMDKLRLTRDVPRCPGTYRFVDMHGTILYVGKADRLRERVRSYFVPGAGHTRKLRQAIHLVERIDWDETHTPLEAVVREQELILEHRPPCNVQGSRPENYMYLKAGNNGPGLSLTISSRQPRWLTSSEHPVRPPRTPLVLGPFRGRARMAQALDVLHHCYPIRRCTRGATERPCVRQECGDCLGPCTGDPGVIERHDSLVMGIVGWLAGETPEGFADPIGLADDLVRSLSRQRRFEEAQRMREGTEALLNVRRSYQSLVEAMSLRFAALWPAADTDGVPAVRLNVVWEGKLREAVSLPNPVLAEEIAMRLDALPEPPQACRPAAGGDGVAVLQRDLDRILALRRWFKESEADSLVMLSGPSETPEKKQQARERLLAEAWHVLAGRPVVPPAVGLRR